MFLTIENFGPIKKFEYDLSKDLIVTYGGNNIGKSYAMQLTYLLLKNLYNYAQQVKSSIAHVGIIPPLETPLYQETEALVKAFSTDTEQSISMQEFFSNALKKDFFEAFVTPFQISCENTFRNIERISEYSPTINIKIDETSFPLTIYNSLNTFNFPFFSSYQFFLNRTKPDDVSDSMPLKRDSDALTIYYTNNVSTTSLIIGIIYGLKLSIAEEIFGELGSIYFLPASRSGLYLSLNTFGAMYTQMAMQRGAFGNNLPLTGIPEPIADYFLSLSSVRKAENQEFSEIYGKIEHDILKEASGLTKTNWFIRRMGWNIR